MAEETRIVQALGVLSELSIAAAALDPNDKIIDVTQPLSALVGGQDIIGLDFHDVLNSAAQEIHSVAEADAKIYRFGEGPDAIWYQVRRRSTSYGETLLLANVSEQVTARLRAETYIDRLGTALEHAQALTFEFDYQTGEYTFFDKGWLQDPLASTDSQRQRPTLHTHPEDKAKLRDLAIKVAGGECPDPIELRRMQDGEENWVRLFFRRIHNADGSLGVGVGTVIDIENYKAQEAELIRARKDAEAAASAKTNFLASMSHEIRTPLNGILGMAQVLALEELSTVQNAHVNTILESGKTLMALLNDVLDLSKIDAGKFSVSPVQGDIRTTLEDTVKLFRPTADEKHLTLDFTCDLQGDFAYDPVRVRQCFSNLLSNAIKFTQKGGVSVRVWSNSGDAKDMIHVLVKDTGIGMTDETIGQLFSAFTQADGSMSRRFGGSGLGLAITRKLARLMGGDTMARSELGRGSEFEFTFQAQSLSSRLADEGAQTQSGNALPQTAAPKSMLGKRVLLVDDNAINRRVASLFMAPAGLEIIEAENGLDALAKLEAEAFDIVLLDIHMPVMDGPETISRIRNCEQEWSDITVLALTADAMSGDRERYLGMGMTDYLAKPLDQRVLLSKLAKYLRGSQDREGVDSAHADLDASETRHPADLTQGGGLDGLLNDIDAVAGKGN